MGMSVQDVGCRRRNAWRGLVLGDDEELGPCGVREEVEGIRGGGGDCDLEESISGRGSVSFPFVGVPHVCDDDVAVEKVVEVVEYRKSLVLAGRVGSCSGEG